MATDLAEALVRSGVPFRQAHAIVGALVRRSIAGEGSLADLSRSEPNLADSDADLFAAGAAVRNRTSPGGASPGNAEQQSIRLERTIFEWRGRFEDVQEQTENRRT